MPVPRKGNGAASLEAEQQALAVTNNRIAEASRKREQLLLGDDEAAIDRADSELGMLGRMAKRSADRIKLLEVEAQRQEAQAVAKRRISLIQRIEKQLNTSADVFAVEIQNVIAQFEKSFQQLVAARAKILPAWNWSTEAQEACCLSGSSIRRLIEFELYRQSGKVFTGGSDWEPVQMSLPGSRPPDLVTRMPHAVKPLAETLREANAHASKILRNGELAAPAELLAADEIEEPAHAAAGT